MTFTFRKKPVDVQAWQYIRVNIDKLNSDETNAIPAFLLKHLGENTLRAMPDGSIHLMTSAGQLMAVPDGYWIVQGEDGALFTCAPDIFTQTYDFVED